MEVEPASPASASPLPALRGFTVGITADRRWQEQAELFERRGAAVLHGPTIRTLYLDEEAALRSATEAVIAAPPDVLVANTGIGIRAWFESATQWGLELDLVDALSSSSVIARGPKAAGAATVAGLQVERQVASEQLDEIVGSLLALPAPGRVAIQMHGSPTEIAGPLVAAGWEVVEIPVYRWRRPDDETAALRLLDACLDGRLDAVTFTSAPALRNLFELAAEQGLDGRLRTSMRRDVLCACIGPVCAAAARELGVSEPLEPSVGRLGLLVRTLDAALLARVKVLNVGAVSVELRGSVVAASGGAEVELSPRERRLFALLGDRPGAVVGRSVLLDRVWGPGADPHVVSVTANRLRSRLAPLGVGIRAVSGRGYRLDAVAG